MAGARMRHQEAVGLPPPGSCGPPIPAGSNFRGYILPHPMSAQRRRERRLRLIVADGPLMPNGIRIFRSHRLRQFLQAAGAPLWYSNRTPSGEMPGDEGEDMPPRSLWWGKNWRCNYTKTAPMASNRTSSVTTQIVQSPQAVRCRALRGGRVRPEVTLLCLP